MARMKNKTMKIYYRGPDLGGEGGIPVGGGLAPEMEVCN